MKILAINLPNLDLSYFKNRGLTFDVYHLSLDRKFPTRYLYDVLTEDKKNVQMFTPWVETLASEYAYDFILFGFKAEDYPNIQNTGGYSHHTASQNGSRWSTIRLDGNENKYAVHELHHQLCNAITNILGVGGIDYMDWTPVNGNWSNMQPYYLNNHPENPLSNHAVTWKNIERYLPQLMAFYDESFQVQITRTRQSEKQTIGLLRADRDGATLWLATLELPWKNNRQNISCIPPGIYEVKWTFSPRFLRFTYEIIGVPARTGIRIHSANFVTDLQGCISLGLGLADLNKDGHLDMVKSKLAIKRLEDFLSRKSFKIKII